MDKNLLDVFITAYFTNITANSWSINKIIPVSIALIRIMYNKTYSAKVSPRPNCLKLVFLCAFHLRF